MLIGHIYVAPDESNGRCACGVYCQDHGLDGGCRYMTGSYKKLMNHLSQNDDAVKDQAEIKRLQGICRKETDRANRAEAAMENEAIINRHLRTQIELLQGIQETPAARAKKRTLPLMGKGES